MDTKDLRIGNWVKNKRSGRCVQIREVLTTFIGVPVDTTPVRHQKQTNAPVTSWEPVELTSDILEKKCGFEWNEALDCWVYKLDNGSVLFIEYDENKHVFKMILRPYAYIHLPYLHKLQNVFYELTEGIELKIKPL